MQAAGQALYLLHQRSVQYLSIEALIIVHWRYSLFSLERIKTRLPKSGVLFLWSYTNKFLLNIIISSAVVLNPPVERLVVDTVQTEAVPRSPEIMFFCTLWFCDFDLSPNIKVVARTHNGLGLFLWQVWWLYFQPFCFYHAIMWTDRRGWTLYSRDCRLRE